MRCSTIVLPSLGCCAICMYWTTVYTAFLFIVLKYALESNRNAVFSHRLELWYLFGFPEDEPLQKRCQSVTYDLANSCTLADEAVWLNFPVIKIHSDQFLTLFHQQYNFPKTLSSPRIKLSLQYLYSVYVLLKKWNHTGKVHMTAKLVIKY